MVPAGGEGGARERKEPRTEIHSTQIPPKSRGRGGGFAQKTVTISLLAGVLTEVLFEGFFLFYFFIETFQDFIIAGSICPYRIE